VKPRTWRLLGGLLVMVTMSRPLGAQRTLVIDAGLTAIRFTDDDARAVGPWLRLDAAGVKGPLFAKVDAGAITTVGASSGFGTLEAGVRASPSRGWVTELAGELSTVAGSGYAGATTALGSGRVMWTDGVVGAWLRAAGHGSDRPNTTLTGQGIDAGAWWGWPRGRVTASLQQEWTRAELYTGRFRTGYAGTAPVRYTEANMSMHVEGDRASLDVGALVRRDPDAPRTFEPGFSVQAAYWTSDTRAFVFTVGRQLPDWVHGADAADAMTVGMRFRQPTPAADREARLIPVVHVVDTDDARVLRVRATGARQVEVMGDFTGWEPQSLERKGATFERAMAIASGTHRMLLRIDGGAWKPAANTPSVDDDLGGRAGLLVVP
jgi:hypothetical protein